MLMTKKRPLRTSLSRIRQALIAEINRGQAEVAMQEERIIIRLAEQGSFASGRAEIKPSFRRAVKQTWSVTARRDRRRLQLKAILIISPWLTIRSFEITGTSLPHVRQLSLNICLAVAPQVTRENYGQRDGGY